MQPAWLTHRRILLIFVYIRFYEMNFSFSNIFKQKIFLFSLFISCVIGFFSYSILSKIPFLMDYHFVSLFILFFVCLVLSLLLFFILTVKMIFSGGELSITTILIPISILVGLFFDQIKKVIIAECLVLLFVAVSSYYYYAAYFS